MDDTAILLSLTYFCLHGLHVDVLFHTYLLQSFIFSMKTIIITPGQVLLSTYVFWSKLWKRVEYLAKITPMQLPFPIYYYMLIPCHVTFSHDLKC